MGPTFGPFVVAVVLVILQTISASSSSSDNDHFEPMVAFMCRKPAMHRVTNGWEKDTTTDCLSEKIDILKYCQRMYPDHQISNIVEASYMVNIPNWPSKQGRQHTHTVRPYRCIVGQFQSDALLVPQHCEFDHYHNTDTCKNFDQWNLTAIQMCTERNMSTESFAMLLQCGLDAFNGVEFVCCPKGKTSASQPVHLKSHDDHDVDDDEDEDDEDDEDSSEETDPEEEETTSEEEEDVHVKTMAANKPDAHGNAYREYLKGEIGEFKNEHAWFLAARRFMRKDQQAKITKLMKEWQAAREHVAELRKNDPKSAQSLSHEITERFQRLYQSYEQEDLAEKKQIVALHQQHVQRDLNKRKRVAMEKYMSALQQKDVHKALKYLRAYFRAEEKDKMHTVNHYQHVKYTEPAELPRIRPHYREHIELINQRINQSLQMLARYPEIEEKVKPEIEKFALRYRAVDASATNIIMNDADETELPVEVDSSEEVQTDDPETHEDEHAYEHDSHFVAHVVNEGMQVGERSEAMDISIHSVSNHVGSTFGIAIGSVAIFVIIVVAIVMLRRRNRQQPVTHGYVEVDPAASPEERHVANMQMNGYENPTYKYFEMSPPQQ